MTVKAWKQWPHERTPKQFGWYVRARPDNSAVAEVEVYKIIARGEDGSPLGEDDRDSVCTVPTNERAHWQRWLHGSVRFDGCSNLYFDQQVMPADERGPECPATLHFCGREDAKSLAAMMDDIYDLALLAMGRESYD